jgi:predicted membrane metal-binding protein
MAVRVTRNLGLLVLAIWLIVSGLAGLVSLPLPPIVMPVIALVAGVLILAGR